MGISCQNRTGNLTAQFTVEETLLAQLPEKVDQLQFSHWSFALIDWPWVDRVLSHHTNLPTEWQTLYNQEGWSRCDPPRAHGMRSLAPLHWHAELFEEAPHMREALQALGILHGMTQACHHASGLVGILSLGRAEPLHEVEFQAKSTVVLSLIHELCCLSVPPLDDACADPLSYLASPYSQLTGREIAALAHAAAGLTVAQAAARMALSERTAQFHISSACVKLGVPNKTAAVAMAIKLQLF